MPTPMHPDLVRPYEPGREIKADELNSFLRKAREVHQPTQGFSGPDFTVQNERQFAFEELIGRNNLGIEIPRYSVFSIGGGSLGLNFDLREPKVRFRQFEVGDRYLLTNGQEVVPSGVSTRATLIGQHDYYLLRYDPEEGVPLAGDVVGPTAGTWTVSKSGDPIFICLTNGGETGIEADLVWCALFTRNLVQQKRGKIPIAGEGNTGQILHGEAGNVQIWQLTGDSGSFSHVPTGEIVYCANLSNVTLVSGILLVISYMSEYVYPLIFPDELEECFNPELEPQPGG